MKVEDAAYLRVADVDKTGARLKGDVILVARANVWMAVFIE